MAIADIARIDELRSTGQPVIAVYRRGGEAPEAVRCRLLSAARVSLSDVVPKFEHMGATVVDERPYEIAPRGEDPVWVYDFGLRCDPEGCSAPATEFSLDVPRRLARRARGRSAQRAGDAGRPVGPPDHDHPRRPALPAPGGDRVLGPVHDHDDAGQPGDRGAAGRPVRRAVRPRRTPTPTRRRGCRRRSPRRSTASPSLDEDRILRSVLAVLGAMLRTNYYRRSATVAPLRATCRSSSTRPSSRCCRCRARGTRSSSTRRGWRGSTCGAAGSPAAGCAGRTGARTSGPRCWG